MEIFRSVIACGTVWPGVMGCVPDSGAFDTSVFVAPLLLARGLGRRAAQWLVINHQRHLQKLSLRRRRHRQALSKKSRSCSVPLVSSSLQEHECRIRPRSEPITCCSHHPPSPLSSQGEGSPVDLHVSDLHLPVEPLLVICSHPEDTCGSPAGGAQDEAPDDVGWLRHCSSTCLVRVSLRRSCNRTDQEAAALLAHAASGWTHFVFSFGTTLWECSVVCGVASSAVYILSPHLSLVRVCHPPCPCMAPVIHVDCVHL